jgi:hypothetical protein
MTSWDYLDTFFSDMFTDAYDDSTAARPSFSEPAPAPLSMPPMSSPQFQSAMTDKFQSSMGQSSMGDKFQSSMEDKYHEGQYIPQELSREAPQQSQPIAPPQQPQQQQQQPPSPRKSLFDFVSPFDALANTTTSIPKKKPVPAGPASASSTNEDSWTSASLASLSNDPKRKSVENLMDQLTRPQPPPYSGQPPSPTYYSTTDEYSQVESTPQLIQPRTMPPPLPPKPGRAPSPPKPDRSSPPKQAAQQQPRRAVESPLGQAPILPMRREKDSSPGPRNTWKGESRVKGAPKGKAQTSPRQVSQPSNNIPSTNVRFSARNLKLLYLTCRSCWTMYRLLETP